jgi:hypothetical protein
MAEEVFHFAVCIIKTVPSSHQKLGYTQLQTSAYGWLFYVLALAATATVRLSINDGILFCEDFRDYGCYYRLHNNIYVSIYPQIHYTFRLNSPPQVYTFYTSENVELLFYMSYPLKNIRPLV